MPCPSATVTTDTGVPIRDLLELHPFQARSRFRPTTRGELVRAVLASGSASLRALGSTYSLSRAGDAKNVVSTDALNMHLSRPLGAPRPLPSNRLRAGPDFLARIRNDPQVAGRCFIHVEAGIKIKHLFLHLKECGLDVPTSGAGGGQSLAGALSTGTHGADFSVPLLVDWIRAAHVVSTGGKEYWITNSQSPFGRADARPDVCADTQFLADAATLNALRVGVGRFGVVYSLVLEVVPAYGLLEVYFQHAWPELRRTLVTSAAADPSGAFDTPLSDLESGWVRAETRRRMIVKYSPPFEPTPSNAVDMDYVGGPPHDPAPVHASLEPRLLREMLNELGLGPLSAALRGAAPKPLHHMDIAISLSEPDKCWVTRRWRVPPSAPKIFQTGLSGPPDPIQAVVEDSRNHRRSRLSSDPCARF